MRCTVLVLVVVAAGCGGGGSGAPPPRLPHGIGSELAAHASAVEASLARGDTCRAAAAALQLRQMVAGAIASGQVPVALRRPLAASATALAAEITCTPPLPPKTDKHGPGKGHGHGHGHDHGHEGDGGKD